MSERTYSAGLVTAYGAAVRGGYRGTYAQFCAQQAEYAENAAAVEQAKTDAQSAATSAAGSATSAGASATAAAGSATSADASAAAAAGSATTAGQHKDAAATSATNAASSATAAEAAATSAATSASAAQAVKDSIPQDYTELSSDVTQLKADLDVLSKGEIDDIDSEYIYPTYSAKALNSDGTLSDNTAKRCTNYLSVRGGETIYLCNALTEKVAFYDELKTFISPLVTVSSGLNPYTVPQDAKYAIYQNVASGSTVPFNVRKKNAPTNKGFFDLITSPLKSRPQICITGDSNTYGFGLSDTSLSWANMYMNALANEITYVRHAPWSEWCECFGATKDDNMNFKAGSELSVWTDAYSVTFVIGSDRSSVYDWYVDGVLQEGFTTTPTLTGLDGELHKITVKVTDGQARNPHFEIPKTITFSNRGVSGVSSFMVEWDTGMDWLIIMIGTNNRGHDPFNLPMGLFEYYGKGTFVCPFPNHKSSPSYTHSQMYAYSTLIRLFKLYGFEVLNTETFASEFYDTELYQSDLIHFSELGHRKIANIVSSMMGFPLCLMAE